MRRCVMVAMQLGFLFHHALESRFIRGSESSPFASLLFFGGRLNYKYGGDAIGDQFLDVFAACSRERMVSAVTDWS